MKVCLIGNNLTSLILANILSEKNFYTEIFSLKGPKLNFKTRTLGITNSNLIYLEKYFKNISKKTNLINKIQVLIKNKKINKEILFNKDIKTLFSMVKYDKLYSIIESKSTRNKYIKFKYFKKDTDLLVLKNKKDFKLIINCEKHNFLTKKFLKYQINKNYYNKAFTTIINHKKLVNNKAIQIFTDFGPVAFLPLSEKKTSVVFSFDIKKKNNISEDAIIELIKDFNPIYKIISMEKLEYFNLELKLPKKYYYENILFFGDAIHSIHPLAGQGFNMTIRDIKTLNNILSQKINLGMNIDKNIFNEFEKETKSKNSVFSFGIDFIHEFFKFNKDYVPKNISETIIDFINNNQKIKNLSIKFANHGSL